MLDILIAIPIFYIILLVILPKGSPLHELIHLPPYWVRTYFSRDKTLSFERISFGNHKRQYTLLFVPKKGVVVQNKIIIYYHGGGWRSGSPEMFRSNAMVLAQQGYIVFMPSYRLTPKFAYPEIREDLNGALSTIVATMKERKWLDKKIILGGMSAGGNVAALMGYDRKNLQKIGLDQSIFSGFFFGASPLDLNEMGKSFVLRDFAGKRNSETFKLANPISHLQENESLPVLIMHGTSDGFVPYTVSMSFAQKLEVLNPNLIKFHTIENGTHLEAGSWPFKDDEVRNELLTWLSYRN